MELREIVFGMRRERIIVDGMELGGVICPLIKMNGWNVYIYGGGKHIEALILFLWNLGIEVKGILDCDKNKEGKKVLDKVHYIYPYHISSKFNPDNTFALINTVYFRGIEQYEIVRLLYGCGITKFYEINEIEKKEIRAKVHPWVDVGRIEYYRENIEELENFYSQLYDDKSKEIMIEYIRTYVEFGTYQLKQCSGDVKYFYGQNSDGTKEELYRHLENEVWINCGSNIGDNIFWYFANGLTAKKIYAYETDENIYARLVKNLSYLPEEYRNRVCPVNEYINNTTCWENLKMDRISFVNADIEGAELDLLKSMRKIIVANRPVLAICVYHKAEDLVEIPKYIQLLVSDFCFVLRKYESNVENAKRTSELVLYAIPKERIGSGLIKT